MTYFGHTCRNKECLIMKECIQGTLEGIRKQGRPRTSYIDNIKVWTNLSKSADVYRRTESRREWRETVRNVTRAANAEDQIGNLTESGGAD